MESEHFYIFLTFMNKSTHYLRPHCWLNTFTCSLHINLHQTDRSEYWLFNNNNNNNESVLLGLIGVRVGVCLSSVVRLPGRDAASHKTNTQSRCWTGWWGPVRIWSLNNTRGILRKTCRSHLDKRHQDQEWCIRRRALLKENNYSTSRAIITVKEERLDHHWRPLTGSKILWEGFLFLVSHV